MWRKYIESQNNYHLFSRLDYLQIRRQPVRQATLETNMKSKKVKQNILHTYCSKMVGVLSWRSPANRDLRANDLAVITTYKKQQELLQNLLPRGVEARTMVRPQPAEQPPQVRGGPPQVRQGVVGVSDALQARVVPQFTQQRGPASFKQIKIELF